MSEVPLVDLEVIVRYSLAIRQELAPAEEVLAALDESRAFVLSLLGGEPENSNGEEPGTQAEAEAPSPPSDRYEDVDLDEEVRAAEDQVALDDLDDSGDEVDGTPGLDPEPARVRRQPLRRARPPAPVPPDPAPPAAADEPGPLEPDEDEQAWVDEVDRIRQRRIRKARREAEERQARQAELAAKVERARLAEEALQAVEAREAEEARRAEDAARAEAAEARQEREFREELEAAPASRRRRSEQEEWDEPPPAPAPRRRRAERIVRRARAGEPRPGQVARVPEAAPLDDALELPTPLPADEAARRREERRRRRAGSGPT